MVAYPPYMGPTTAPGIAKAFHDEVHVHEHYTVFYYPNSILGYPNSLHNNDLSCPFGATTAHDKISSS